MWGWQMEVFEKLFEFNTLYPFAAVSLVFCALVVTFALFKSRLLSSNNSFCHISDEFMMTSSDGNIFRVTGPLCGESPHKRQ